MTITTSQFYTELTCILEIIIQTCQKSIAGIVMLEIQRFVKNMEDRQVVDETKESFLDIENGRIRTF